MLFCVKVAVLREKPVDELYLPYRPYQFFPAILILPYTIDNNIYPSFVMFNNRETPYFQNDSPQSFVLVDFDLYVKVLLL